MGGIGKTALAVEAAHQARAKGWFRGGYLFVDLRGYDDNPVTADQGVLALLDAMGVHGADLPPTTARQYDVYHVLLTERRDRTLLILDNASEASQFLPLLPGTDRHRVLITSRDRPDSLPLRLIDLEELTPEESTALVTRALHDYDERDERPAREPDALRELTDLCGHLPLALQIAAAMLRRRRRRNIASLVAEIRDTGDAVAVLDRGGKGTDLYGRSLVLRPVLETSYRRLPPEQARLLRLLALAPTSETGTDVVAALTDLDAPTALSLLDDLAATHLVTPVGTGTSVRWRVHDLVRGFGVGVVEGDAGLRERGVEARARVLAFYLHSADAADDRLRWLPGRAEPDLFGDRGAALAWFDGERAGLVAAVVAWGREGRLAEAAVRLAERLARYLEWRRHFDDWIAAGEAAREAACRIGDRPGEAGAWNNLGIALREAGRVDRAVDAHTRARDLYQTERDRHHEAFAWNNLGLALRDAGRVREAVDAHTRARDLYQTERDRHREATAWNNLGLALRKAGRVQEAVDTHTRARDLFQAEGDQHGAATAWLNLGTALWTAGRADEAVAAFATAIAICREFEDSYGEAHAQYNLGLLHSNADRPSEARAHYLQAADAYTRANAPDEAAEARTRAAALPEHPPPPVKG
ncbi:tetratricopeptide repeat protein [Streptomyces sp. NPDC058739]|uniref:tetratricopeptide repeat protein n=1 Tax=Streptomyces sp. NPDC058739 TaxID=3346618 RepID=UPI003685145E